LEIKNSDIKVIYFYFTNDYLGFSNSRWSNLCCTI